MPRYRRASFTFFSIGDDELLDVQSLLRGHFEVSAVTQLFALSPLTAAKHALGPEELELLLRIPEDSWLSESDLLPLGTDSRRLEELARHGILVSDSTDPELSELRRRAETLESQAWHPYAALYHFMTRSAEYDFTFEHGSAEDEIEARANRFVAEHGPPPASFNTFPRATRVELPVVERKGELYEVLKRRRTIRSFDTSRELSTQDLSTLLYYAFGCHGHVHLSPEVLLLHRTSPSGGSRHPVEVYPVVLRAENVAPGLYHYNLRGHALERLRELELEEAEKLAVEFGGGQAYMKNAHVIFILTARFYRNYWKYRRVSKSYSVILMDAAHLIQTFYLVAADLDLGAFMSAAMNTRRIDEALGIDSFQEGSVAICGCGVKPPEGIPDYGLKFRPFVPREDESDV